MFYIVGFREFAVYTNGDETHAFPYGLRSRTRTLQPSSHLSRPSVRGASMEWDCIRRESSMIINMHYGNVPVIIMHCMVIITFKCT